MARAFPASILLAVLALSCGGETLGPTGDRCGIEHGVEVCVDRLEYGTGERIVVTTRNISGSPVFKDGCGTSTVRVSDSREVRGRYLPRLRCGVGVTRETIVARMVRLEHGASTEEALPVRGFVVQGYYQVQVWLLNADGALAADTAVRSGVFGLVPSANK